MPMCFMFKQLQVIRRENVKKEVLRMNCARNKRGEGGKCSSARHLNIILVTSSDSGHSNWVH